MALVVLESRTVGACHTKEPENPPPVTLSEGAAQHGAEDRPALGTGEEDGHGKCPPLWLGGLKSSQVSIGRTKPARGRRWERTSATVPAPMDTTAELPKACTIRRKTNAP